MHVYEVDCDDSSNKRICRNEGVKAYPTLMLCVSFFLFLLSDSNLTLSISRSYNKGASVEYTGRRTVDAMKEFALKAMAALVSSCPLPSSPNSTFQPR